MPILYSLVARGKVVLAEYTSTSGNFPTVTRVILARIQTTDDTKMSMVYDNYVFHYMVEEGIIYLCMADSDDKRRIPFLFLDEIKRRFLAIFGDAAQTAIAFSLNEDFAPTLRSMMDYYNSDPNADSLSKMRNQIDDVKNVMVENIEKVLERGEKIELLVDKTDKLNQQAFTFKRQSRKLQSSMWWNKIKAYVIGFVVVALILFFIVAMGCGGLGFSKCRHH